MILVEVTFSLCDHNRCSNWCPLAPDVDYYGEVLTSVYIFLLVSHYGKSLVAKLIGMNSSQEPLVFWSYSTGLKTENIILLS